MARTSLPSTREAKEFLVARIVEEAQREGVSLSEIERKMLYFSETGWTLPDIMEVNDQFDRDYDQDEYEKKITRLIKHAMRQAQNENPQEYQSWRDAISTLRKEDHYLLVMVNRAGVSVRPPGDQLTLLATALAIVGVVICASLVTAKYNIDLGRYSISRDTLFFVLWLAAVGLSIAYVVLRLVLGNQKAGGLFVKIVERLYRPSDRAK